MTGPDEKPRTACTIPAKIWFYWGQGASEIPDLGRRCIDSFRRMNAGYAIRILDDREIAHAPEFRDIAGLMRPDVIAKPAHRADLLRLHLLATEGGVWADVDCWCAAPLDSWLPEASAEGFHAFCNPGRDRAIASWFLASAAGNPVVREWYARFARYMAAYGTRRVAYPGRRFPKGTQERSFEYLLWLNPLSKAVVRSIPAYAIHYVFQQMAATDAALRRSLAHLRPSDANAALVFRRRGREMTDDEIARHLAAGASPVYKLSRRSADGHLMSSLEKHMRDHG